MHHLLIGCGQRGPANINCHSNISTVPEWACTGTTTCFVPLFFCANDNHCTKSIFFDFCWLKCKYNDYVIYYQTSHADGKTWAKKTVEAPVAPNYLTHRSMQFQQEFPSLTSSGDHKNVVSTSPPAQANTEQRPSLRPQSKNRMQYDYFFLIINLKMYL